MQGPLDGYRILDFTRYQQGPYATVMLSDLGAEIWKVEPPGGDPGRASDLSGTDSRATSKPTTAASARSSSTCAIPQPSTLPSAWPSAATA